MRRSAGKRARAAAIAVAAVLVATSGLVAFAATPSSAKDTTTTTSKDTAKDDIATLYKRTTDALAFLSESARAALEQLVDELVEQRLAEIQANLSVDEPSPYMTVIEAAEYLCCAQQPSTTSPPLDYWSL